MKSSASAKDAASRPRSNCPGCPHHKTLDEFDFAFQPDLDARKVRDLATLPFLPHRGTGGHAASTASNVALLGPPVINGT